MTRRFFVLLAVALGCGGSTQGWLKDSPESKETAHGGNAKLATILDERDKADDALVTKWYDPALLTTDVRPDALRGLEQTAGPLDELTLYDFDLDIADDARSFKLDERVYYENKTGGTLNDVMFRMYANTPPAGEAPEKLLRGHCVQTTCNVQSVGRDTIVVHPEKPLPPGARIRIVLHIFGTLKPIDASKTTMMAAVMGSLQTMTGGEEAPGDYGLLGAGDGIVSFGNFYPVVARHDGDVWDLDQSTLGDIGTDSLSHVRAHVELPAGYRVAASGVVAREEEAGGRRRVDYNAGCMRDFALFASDKFTSADKLVGDVKVRSYFRTSDRKTGERVLDVAAWSLKDFEKRFGPYPYKELVLVEEALVGGAGGVEFAGLATVASMFYKPSGSANGSPLGMLLGMLMGSGDTDGPMKASAAEFTTAHEVGHQWWHGIVGSDSRKHPWQDEAMAQFSAILYSEDRYGAAHAKKDADMNARMGYEMMRLMGQPDGPVDVPAARQTQIAYGGIVYGKGPYYLMALRKKLGDAAFFAGIQAYVKQYYLGFAPPSAIEEVMKAAAPNKATEIASMSKRWLHESHGDDDLGKASFDGLLGMAGASGKGGAGGLAGLLGGGGGAGGLGADDVGKMMKMLGGGGDVGKMLNQMLGGGALTGGQPAP
ncbi:MAG TPA: M1 family aminopeptidase [Polyangiaceae bacterium]|jgi:hypothetical protein